MDVYNTVQKIYNSTLRKYLPKKDRSLAGVNVRDIPLLDMTADNQNYKISLILSIYDYISDDDHVEIVGFGRGVTTTHILRAGASHVVGYEGAPNMIEKGVQTVNRNFDSTSPLEVHHAVVGDPIEIYGDYSDAEIVSPSTLTSADVLVLDCEGAEVSILSDLGTYPETIICESHPTKGAPASKIAELLENHYTVTLRSHKPRKDAKSVVIGTSP